MPEQSSSSVTSDTHTLQAPAGAGIENILQFLHEGVYIVDQERRILYWNAAAEMITGYPAALVVGRKCSDNILRHVSQDGQQLCVSDCPLQKTLADGQTRDLIAYLHHRDGRRLPVHIRAIALPSEGTIPRALEVFSEISERSQLLEELEALRQEVLTDPLTKIGNRRYYELNGQARLVSFHEQGVPLGLLMFDIDHFKAVNDKYGHTVGDSVLQMVAGTIARALRPLDTVARYGGEEFVVLVPDCTAVYLHSIGERIRMLIETSWFDFSEGGRLMITISGGGSMLRPDDTLSTLTTRADSYLYASKHEGRNRITVGD